MGGSGSGRWGGVQTRRTVEGCYFLKFGPGGRLTGSLEGGAQWTTWIERMDDDMVLHLRGEKGGWATEQQIEVVFWEPRFGGKAFWLLCPCCGSKRRALYAPPGKARFWCRKCWGLTYQSCQEAHAWDRGVAASMLAPIARKAGLSLTEVGRALR